MAASFFELAGTKSAGLSRRDWLRLTTAGVVGFSASGWLESLAAAIAKHPQRRRACLLLWMTGGPSQTDTFDLKPGHENGGPFQEIATAVPGIRISEHLPKMAKLMPELALIRSMKTKEADHGRASFHLHTGYVPRGSILYPSLGALLGKELGTGSADIPSFVSIAPHRLFNSPVLGPGFLGPAYAPLVVGGSEGLGSPEQNNYEKNLKVQDMDRAATLSDARADDRVALFRKIERGFVDQHAGAAALGHRTAYERALGLMRSDVSKAFALDQEPAPLRDAYGRNQFGQGCLLARRLLERGVPFVEVAFSIFNGTTTGWDTHFDNFETVKNFSQILDSAWATLMADLKTRGLFDSTLIVWMGEFGRTPKINVRGGRDHYPHAWTTALTGGGIRGGAAIGRTSADATTVEERPISVPDFLATICQALGVDPAKQNDSNLGRPIRIVDKGAQPIQEILA
jgi:hypothetical protein